MSDFLNIQQPPFWKPDYETGIKIIDAEHKYFLCLIGKIRDYLAGKYKNLQAYNIFEEINFYAQFHFRSEENLMKEYSYPGLAKQISEHNKISTQIMIEYSQFENHTAGLEHVYSFLLNWFNTHTIKLDKLFGEYCKLHSIK